MATESRCGSGRCPTSTRPTSSERTMASDDAVMAQSLHVMDLKKHTVKGYTDHMQGMYRYAEARFPPPPLAPRPSPARTPGGPRPAPLTPPNSTSDFPPHRPPATSTTTRRSRPTTGATTARVIRKSSSPREMLRRCRASPRDRPERASTHHHSARPPPLDCHSAAAAAPPVACQIQRDRQRPAWALAEAAVHAAAAAGEQWRGKAWPGPGARRLSISITGPRRSLPHPSSTTFHTISHTARC